MGNHEQLHKVDDSNYELNKDLKVVKSTKPVVVAISDNMYLIAMISKKLCKSCDRIGEHATSRLLLCLAPQTFDNKCTYLDFILK